MALGSRAAHPRDPSLPTRYQGKDSPYYTASHVAFRAKVRAFVEKELKPHMDDWREAGERVHELRHRGAPVERLSFHGSYFSTLVT